MNQLQSGRIYAILFGKNKGAYTVLHYLDNAATTQVLPAAAAAAAAAMTETFGNPSSLHGAGQRAEALVRSARETAAEALGCEPACVIFNSGGTEGDNTAILGAARRLYHAGRHIITTAAEHPAVLQPIAALEQEGFSVTRLPTGPDGVIRLRDLEDALRPDTILVSVMHVNNETGAVMPIREIAALLKRRKSRALFHSDGVQAFMKLPVNVERLGVDLYSVSGHKVHAPKGIGALYIRKGVRIPPLIRGGGQENGMRSGTESVPLIAAFAEALRAAPPVAARTVSALRHRLTDGLRAVHDARVYFPDALPCIVSLSLPGRRAEVIMRILEGRGVYVSTGSACAKGKRSYVLEAAGLAPEVIDGSLRVSLSHTNTPEDIDALLAGLTEAAAHLR